jgi:hypothetical protein
MLVGLSVHQVYLATGFTDLVCTYFRRFRMCGLIDAYISTSKQGAIQAISSSEKVTKGGKVYAEAEGGLPFITKVKGGVEVSGSLEDTNTIVDSTMQEGELGIAYKVRLPTGGLVVEQE